MAQPDLQFGVDSMAQRPQEERDNTCDREISDIASQTLIGSDGALTDGRSPARNHTVKRVRAKHIPLKAAIIPSAGGAALATAGSGVSGSSNGESAGGRDGSGKKTGDSDFPPLEDGLDDEPKSDPPAPKRASLRPSKEDMESLLNDELEAYANEHNLQYAELDKKSYMPAHEEFTKFKWNPNRITAINDLNLLFRKVRRRLNYFMDKLEEARDKYDESVMPSGEALEDGMGIGDDAMGDDKMSFGMENAKLAFSADVNEAYAILARGIPKANLVDKELIQINNIRQHIIDTGFSPSCQNLLKAHINAFLAAYRYNMEALRETYRSRSLTAKSIAELLGFTNLRDLFYTGHDGVRRVRRHVDFGCGDGEILIQLAEIFEEATKSEIGNHAVASLMREIYEMLANFPSDEGIDWVEKSTLMDEGRKKAVSEDFNPKSFERQRKKNFIGIDNGRHFMERLNNKGIGSRVGDICGAPKRLRRSLGINAKSVDVAYTTLTLDRASNKQNLIGNMRRSLRDDGFAIIGLKGDFTSMNDGQGSREDPIDYGSKDDWDLSSSSVSGQLDKLLPLLEKAGLEPVKLASHKSHVICTDCETDPDMPGYGPQEYNLVMLVCRKKSRKA